MQTAEDVSASTTHEASPDRVDEIASLLADESDSETEIDSTESEGQPEESTAEVEESDEDSGSEESETEIETGEDGEDVTWGSVLGLNDEQVVLDEDGNLTGLNVKIDGEVSTVSVKDLVAGYQTNKHNTVKSQILAEERKKFEETTKGLEEQYNGKLDTAESMVKFLGSKLTSEFEGIDWNQLRISNPAEYAALRQDYAMRAQELQAAQQAVTQERQQEQQKAQQAMQEQMESFLKEQHQKMLANNPSWNNPEVLQRDMGELKTFLSNQYGLTDEDFQTVNDARVIEILKDAKAYHQGRKAAQTKMKKAPVARFQKSTGRKPNPVSKLDKLTKAAKNAKGGANKRELQSSAVAELLMSGDKK